MLLTSGLFVGCGSSEKKESSTETKTEQMATTDTEHAYICSMHCENSGSMVAGVCPVCGMDLVKNPDYKPMTPDTTKTAVPDTVM